MVGLSHLASICWRVQGVGVQSHELSGSSALASCMDPIEFAVVEDSGREEFGGVARRKDTFVRMSGRR